MFRVVGRRINNTLVTAPFRTINLCGPKERNSTRTSYKEFLRELLKVKEGTVLVFNLW